ncbi:XRE family transcriptional regulator [Pseudoroseomonas cervicalis]|uniref:helix-turn-helix domain-containing protein n=1 Tax=Teichococcus cervicalis TaxID=204525 RepID=UPI00277E1933|nr:XRE family transcriptional regulator [Pseudoroseomonas cervicalis]MDQ1081051.1 transcriptional regulator with XRE-family HTH domain [Pseudoroseomonas cervicalis]
MPLHDSSAQLAQRLKTEREARGWSLSELAERSGVSKAMISKIERDEVSPTAALLGRLSGAFGLSLSQLLARAEQGAGLLARAAAQPVWRDPETGFLRRAVTPTAGPPTPLELVWGELPPGQAVEYPAAAFAFIQDQQLLVLEGELHFTQGQSPQVLQAGDCLRFGPPDAVRYENRATLPCRYLIALLRR